MVAETWNRYRGWAARSRRLQAAGQRGKLIALVAAAAAALFGALASLQPDQTEVGKILAFLSAAAAAVSAILGRELLSPDNEKNWLHARAVAEAIKSECFLAAARVAPYDDASAPDQLATQADQLEEDALKAGISPLLDPAAEDKRRPPEPGSGATLTKEAYRDIRLRDQQTYYRKRATEHAAAARKLRMFSIGAAIVAALLGIAAGAGQAWLAPWIGALTTVAAAITAWGLLDRRSYLVVSYEAMAYRLSILEGRADAMTVQRLVGAGEELLRSEHTAWAQRMSQSGRTPPAPGPASPNAPRVAAPDVPVPTARN